MDRLLAAFIAGLFLGLMIIKHVGRKVVEVEVDRVGGNTGREGVEVSEAAHPHAELKFVSRVSDG